jgi:hypothetical protein
MNVSKFVLLSGGNAGVVAECTETVPVGNLSIIDKVKRTRPFQVPSNIIEEINKLKYFYLKLTRHWMPPFEKYFDKETMNIKSLGDSDEIPQSYLMLQGLMSNAEIIGVSVSNAGFCILGKIEVISGKKSAITTPLVTEEDDVSFFIEAMERIMKIMDLMAELLTAKISYAIDVPRAAEHLKIEKKIRESLNTDELLNMVVDKLADRGAITIIPGDSIDEFKSNGKIKVDDHSTLYTKTGSIDSEHVDEAANHDDADDSDDTDNDSEQPGDESQDEPQYESSKFPEEKVDIGKGTLASDKGFPILDDTTGFAVYGTSQEDIPEGGNLEEYEYSESLGIAPDTRADDLLGSMSEESGEDDAIMDEKNSEW